MNPTGRPSQSTSTSFARALSPIASIITTASATDDDASAVARQTAYASAATIDDLIWMVPMDYRQVLRPPILEAASGATKLFATGTALDKLRKHKASGTFPSFIVTKNPALQQTRQFASTEEGANYLTRMQEANALHCRALLDQAIAAKEGEFNYLQGAFSTAAFFEHCAPLLKATYTELLTREQLPTWTFDGDGNVVNLTWAPNPAAKQAYEAILKDCATLAFRVRQIVTAREAAVVAKQTAKKDLAKAADTEMADATAPGRSIQSLIDKAINTRVKTLRSFATKVSPRSYDSRTILTSAHSSETLHAEEGWPHHQEAADAPPFSQVRRQANGQGSVSSPPRWTPYPQERQERFRSRKGKEREWQGQGWEEVDGVVERRAVALEDTRVAETFRYDKPSSYPDWLLTIPLPRAMDIIFLNTPIDVIESSRFRNNIHLSTDVAVPLEIQHQLCVGMKFMFHSPRNTELIREAWKDFTERIRWRLFFAFRGENNSLYDPDYEVPRHVKREPPNLPAYLEFGLTLGRNFVLSTISKIPREDERDGYRAHVPNARQIQRFLVENNYVVTNTDKNLGLAVSKRSWIIEKCLDLIQDVHNYRHLHPLTAEQILDKQCTDMEEIAILCERDLPNGTQIGNFLRHRITIPGKKHAVPVFYGIPKIHKEPVKMRPIIPCHSAIQNPAAKYVSKRLKPLIKAAPTIIHGSKDLAIKLSKLKLQHGRRYFIVTGDVVAFYPNIDLEKCLNIVAYLYEAFEYGPNGASTDFEKKEMLIFLKCLNVGNRNLITQYQDKRYLQERGLAMGVADSPDLANLYGFYFEKLRGVLTNPLLPFYGRYIDDCLAIVYANSEQEALKIVSEIKFDNCEIEWNVSEYFQPFLDMRLYRDPGNNNLEHMPYRKARNHMERIPWISHHPLDVKRGTFIGEMSRLATLSSLNSHYCDAVKGLAALYIARGYPSELVYKWLSDNIRERWNKRLSVTTERPADEVLVLKSVYNTAWNYFSARELGETVLGYWRDYITRAGSSDYNVKFPMFSASHGGLDGVASDLCSEIETRDGRHLMPDVTKIDILNRRLITSRKRTRNLFDLTSLWKKTVLSRVEHDALESVIPSSNPHDVSSSDSSDDSDGLEHMFLDLGFRQLVA